MLSCGCLAWERRLPAGVFRAAKMAALPGRTGNHESWIVRDALSVLGSVVVGMLRVLVLEASAGGVLGGSLTGLYHMVRGFDPKQVAAAMVLYEPKSIEAELAAMHVPVYHVRRRRLPKEHGLLKYDGYQRAKRNVGVRSALQRGRRLLRLLTEELPTALQIARVIRRVRPHVVHLGNGVRANFDGIVACKLTRTPCLVHVKGFEKYSDRERAIAPRLDAIVCMTKAVRDHCIAQGIENRRLEVIYDALDEDGFVVKRDAASVRAELGIANGAPCAGVVGNIQEWKGQAVFVEAMAKVVRAVPAARGLIVGGVHRAGGAYFQQLESRVLELGLTDTIVVTGFRSDVADVVNALDVVVHTSVRPEAFGRVILEGMLLAKPVVATAAGGVPELISEGQTGFLTPPGDADRLAEQLIPLLADRQRCRTIGSHAQAWARRTFSLPQHVAAMTALYESIANTKGH